MFLTSSMSNCGLINNGMVIFGIFFLGKITSWAYAVMSGLKNIFHLCAHSEILLRSSFNVFAEKVGSCTVENKEVSSENNLRIGAQFECLPLTTTLWYLSLRKLRKRLRSFSKIPIDTSLYSRPSCHTLSNALEISKKFPRTSSDGLWSKSA